MQTCKKPILQTIKNIQKEKNFISNWNISYQIGLILSEFISLKNPKNILEVGTSNGFSTLWLALNLDDSSLITTVEIDQFRFNQAKNNFNQAKIQNIKQLNGDIFEILENYSFEEKFDFVFVDAIQKNYFLFLEKIVKKNLISNNSIIIFDNIDSHLHQKDFLKKIENNYKFEKIAFGTGLLVVWLNS